MRKYLYLTLLLIGAFPRLIAQEPATSLETVLFDQGNIIGTLPYGRYFFIEGSTKLPYDGRADKVTVSIWRGKKLRGTKDIIKAQDLPLISTSWVADRSDDISKFRLYINQPLELMEEYILEFIFYERLSFNLTENQKNEIIQSISQKVFDEVKRQQGIGKTAIKNIINGEVYSYLGTLDDYATYFPTGTDLNSEAGQVPISEATLEHLSRQIGSYSTKLLIVKELTEQIKTVKDDLKNAVPGSTNYNNIQEELDNFIEQKRIAQEEFDALRDSLPNMLVVVREKLVETFTSYVITSPEIASVTELQALKIGTTFGGGLVGLNFQNEQARDLDVLSYTALKFYLSPVDKRIKDPYLDNRFFISRLSILLGFSLTQEINYKGASLDRALGFYPVAGLSYDLNRYISIDLGGTLFKQQSLSPLTNTDEIRVAPILGITFDADLFNRMRAVFGGEAYKINQGGGF